MDVITQTKHYFSSFQTANLVEGITGLSSHYIIPSGSCKVHRRASNGHCFFSTSNNVRTMASKLWCKDLHWLPHGCCSQMPAWQETCSLLSDTDGRASSNLLDFWFKKTWTHKCKNKGKQKTTRNSSDDFEEFPLRGKSEQKLYFSLFHVSRTSLFGQGILFT